MPNEVLEKLQNLKLELEKDEDLSQKSSIELWWEEVFAEMGVQ